MRSYGVSEQQLTHKIHRAAVFLDLHSCFQFLRWSLEFLHRCFSAELSSSTVADGSAARPRAQSQPGQIPTEGRQSCKTPTTPGLTLELELPTWNSTRVGDLEVQVLQNPEYIFPEHFRHACLIYTLPCIFLYILPCTRIQL